MWRRKVTPLQKLHNQVRAEKRRRALHPTRRELLNKEGALQYCRTRGLAAKASQRVVNLVTGVVDDIDWDDQRTIPKQDRVPRSLEEPGTPPRYWEVTNPGDTK